MLAAGEAAGIQALRRLTASGHRLVAVLAAADEDTARGATVAGVAEQLGVPLWPDELVRDPALAERLAAESVDLLLNVHSLLLVRAEILAAPRIGSFNLHPGPLPEYAGLNAPSWAITNGERRHAATLHWMEPRIDTGDVAYEDSFPIEPQDTGLSVSAKCVRHGLPLLDELLAAAAEEPASIPRRPQDLSHRRLYTRGEIPYDGGRVDWSLPARRIVDFVRACDYGPFPSPWGRPQTRLGGLELRVLRATATGEATAEPPGTLGERSDGSVRVAAADEWVAVERVEVDGASRHAAEALDV